MSTRAEAIDLGGAPALVVSTEDPDTSAERGTVLFYHGFSAGREVNHKELALLAEAGFAAVGIDAVGHGNRRDPDWDAKFGEGGDWETHFLDLVRRSSAEVPTIIDALIVRGWAHRGRIGICGISMGGMIAFGALPSEQRISAAVSIVSAPRTLTTTDLAKIPPCAILSQSAGRDTTVPASEAERFHQRMAGYYREMPERNAFINYPESEHMMRADDWDQGVMPRTVRWFQRFLG